MEQRDHLRVIAELDVLAEQVASTIQRFETTGFTAIMKKDYVELHALEHCIIEMRLVHSRAIDEGTMPCGLPTKSH